MFRDFLLKNWLISVKLQRKDLSIKESNLSICWTISARSSFNAAPYFLAKTTCFLFSNLLSNNTMKSISFPRQTLSREKFQRNVYPGILPLENLSLVN